MILVIFDCLDPFYPHLTLLSLCYEYDWVWLVHLWLLIVRENQQSGSLDPLHILFVSACCCERKRQADRETERIWLIPDVTDWGSINKALCLRHISTDNVFYSHMRFDFFLFPLHRSSERWSWASACGSSLTTRASLLFYVSVTLAHTSATSLSDNTHVSKHSAFFLTHVSSAGVNAVEWEIEIWECACQILKPLAYSAELMWILSPRTRSQGTTKGIFTTNQKYDSQMKLYDFLRLSKKLPRRLALIDTSVEIQGSRLARGGDRLTITKLFYLMAVNSSFIFPTVSTELYFELPGFSQLPRWQRCTDRISHLTDVTDLFVDSACIVKKKPSLRMAFS